MGSFDEELATVALGRAIAFTSAAAARLYPRPDLAYVPLAGAAPCTVALAWNPARRRASSGSVLAAARRAREQARGDSNFGALAGASDAPMYHGAPASAPAQTRTMFLALPRP